MNRFSLIGRLIKDPELRYNKDNLAISEVTLATYEKETQFIRVKIYGKQAENMNKYCKKGTLIGVLGYIKNNNYEDKEGNKHYEYAFIVQNIEFLSKPTEKKEDQKEIKQNDNEEIYKQFGESIEFTEDGIAF